MLISKLDLTFFSPHRKGVGFQGDYELRDSDGNWKPFGVEK